MNQQAQALENAASGERVTHSIHFPATGDDELDMMNAFMCVLNTLGRVPYQNIPNDNRMRRVLQWFFARTQDIHGLPVVREVQVPNVAQTIQSLPYMTDMLPQTIWGGIGNPPLKKTLTQEQMQVIWEASQTKNSESC